MSKTGGVGLRFERCPCCGSRDFAEYYINPSPSPIDGWRSFFYGNWSSISDVFQCVQCQYGFINTPAEDLEQFYRLQDTKEYVANRKFRVKHYKAVKQKLEKQNQLDWPEPAKILDLGAGGGEWLSLWKGRCDVYGTEISPNLLISLQEKGITIVDDQCLGGISYDVISMFDYLEHVQNPRLEIAKAKRHLAESGYLFVSVPNMGKFFSRVLRERYYLYTPMHLSYFTDRSLRCLLSGIFSGRSTIDIFPSPTMHTNLRTVLKWLRIPVVVPSMLNMQMPVGYSANLIAVVRTCGGAGE